MKKPTENGGWGAELEKKFICGDNRYITVAYPDIGIALKSFIRDLLYQQKRDLVEKIGKMGRQYFKTHKEVLYAPYDQAISDVISLLEEK